MLFRSDVWSSPDGSEWTKATDSAEFSARHSYQLVSFDPDKNDTQGEQLFTIGGSVFGVGDTNEIWQSNNGKDWFNAVPLLKGRTAFPAP